MAISLEGAYAYMTNFMDHPTVDGSVWVIDLATNTVVEEETVPAAGRPNWVTITGRHK